MGPGPLAKMANVKVFFGLCKSHGVNGHGMLMGTWDSGVRRAGCDTAEVQPERVNARPDDPRNSMGVALFDRCVRRGPQSCLITSLQV